MTAAPAHPEPFAYRTPAGDVADFRARLRATRWDDADDDAPWSSGIDLDTLRELVSYGAEGFDWPAEEERLATLPRFRVEVGGLGIHVVHARATTGRGLPLVLTHGWPDSFWRYRKVVDLLTDPAAHGADPDDAFDVIVPDMPGFGYSAKPAVARDAIAVAHLWAQLMTTLGYERFVAAGGDIGGHVSRYLALEYPDRVLAVHRTDAGLPHPAALPDDLSPAEQQWLDDVGAWGAREGAYAAMHRTKPLTAGVGLTDSPAGLIAWIAEKMHAWSDGGLSAYTPDEVLTNVGISWFTATIGSSMRMYRANAAIAPAQVARRVEVPSGFTLFPADILRPPREWLERTTRLVSLTEADAGGHFAAFEQPEAYARALRDFFRPFRTPQS